MIELIRTCVSENEVYVSSSHTLYANEKRLEFKDLEKTMLSLKLLKSKAKEKGIKIKGQNLASKKLKDLEDEAIKEYKEYIDLFEQYLEKWKYVDLSSGIPIQFAKELSENGVYDLRDKMSKYMFRNTKLSLFLSLSNRILKVEEDLSRYEYNENMTIFL